jgi:magnesium-transporting ATPase (P-type)
VIAFSLDNAAMKPPAPREPGSAQRTGLSEVAAAERLRVEGYNDLPTARHRGLLAIAGEVLREPMFLLLVACGAIYIVLGDPHEALMLLGFVFLITGVTLYQEHKTERALDKLRDLASPRALVVRDGQQRRIPGRDVVRDDLFLLEEGDRVPADAVVVSATNLSVDESLLTGESIPVRKTAAHDAPAMPPPGAMIYRSSIRAPSSFTATGLVKRGRPAPAPRSGGSAKRWRRSNPKKHRCRPRPAASSASWPSRGSCCASAWRSSTR